MTRPNKPITTIIVTILDMHHIYTTKEPKSFTADVGNRGQLETPLPILNMTRYWILTCCLLT
ncbi:hypothetical protein Hanom_Chr12g01084731 [Helianthus anomalus]